VASTSDDTRETPRDDADPEVAELRDEIEQTRSEMSETIDAIQERLSPQQLADDAKEAASSLV
jgi:cell division protein FtsL